MKDYYKSANRHNPILVGDWDEWQRIFGEQIKENDNENN